MTRLTRKAPGSPRVFWAECDRCGATSKEYSGGEQMSVDLFQRGWAKVIAKNPKALPGERLLITILCTVCIVRAAGVTSDT